MAVDMFLKFTPDLKGEYKDHKMKDAIDVLAWSWGASQSGSTHTGSGGGSGKVNVQDISITKYVDLASPTLFLKCANGTHFDSATLTVRKAGGDNPVDYLKIEMTEVMITSYTTGGSGGEDRLTENVSLNFAKVKMNYVAQSDKGAKAGNSQSAWDIAGNTKM